MGGIVALLGVIGQAVAGLFNFKAGQTEVVQEAIRVLGDINSSAAQRDAASAVMLSQSHDSFLARNARPFAFLVCLGLIVAKFFGLESSHMTPDQYDWVFMIAGAYMGVWPMTRTIDKIASGIISSKMLETLVGKKIL